MTSRVQLLTGIGLGVGLVYLFDPQRGGRRRARFRDTAVSVLHTATGAAETTTRDVRNRIAGTTAELRGRWIAEPWVDNRRLVERVRSKLGRLVSHPHAIVVEASNGVVTLKGPVLRSEVSRLLRTVEHVRGVRDVLNQLDEHKQTDHVPALQGGAVPRGIHLDLWQQQWAPATRLAVGSAALVMTAIGASRRRVSGSLLMVGG